MNQIRFWSIIFLLGGLAFLAGSIALFTFSRQPTYGLYQLGCAVIFFGAYAYFRAHLRRQK